MATDDYDVVVEGVAELVTDRVEVARIANIAADGGWSAKADESGTALTAPNSALFGGTGPVARVPSDADEGARRAGARPGGATAWAFD